jgi:penicillin-binding protein 1A
MRLSDDASGESVVAEYFRDGEEPVFGLWYDGGFAMGVNLPLFEPGETEADLSTVRTSEGAVIKIPKKASSGSVAAGGLY